MNTELSETRRDDLSVDTIIALEEAAHPRWYKTMFAAWVGFGICCALILLGIGGCTRLAN